MKLLFWMLGDEEDINIWSSRFLLGADVCLLPVGVLFFLEEITFWHYKVLLKILSKRLVDSAWCQHSTMS